VEVATLLLTAGAQVDAQNQVSCGWFLFVLTSLPQKDGLTPLHDACSGGHVEVVTLLLSAGASIEVQTVVRSQFELSSFIYIQDEKTPLHIACAHGAVGVVSELLAAGAQIEARDKVSEFEDLWRLTD
jgi:ankyrin repeat protein